MKEEVKRGEVKRREERSREVRRGQEKRVLTLRQQFCSVLSYRIGYGRELKEGWSRRQRTSSRESVGSKEIKS